MKLELSQDALTSAAVAFLESGGRNRVTAEQALSPAVVGLRLWDHPLFGLSAADDPLYSGLGTFGLSKGLITERGICGRFGSLVTDAPAVPTPRPYTGLYDYCTRCGACVHRCPVDAIDPEQGKDHSLCSEYVTWTEEEYAPRYGCGKCQVGVPCASKRPKPRPRKSVPSS